MFPQSVHPLLSYYPSLSIFCTNWLRYKANHLLLGLSKCRPAKLIAAPLIYSWSMQKAYRWVVPPVGSSPCHNTWLVITSLITGVQCCGLGPSHHNEGRLYTHRMYSVGHIVVNNVFEICMMFSGLDVWFKHCTWDSGLLIQLVLYW